MEDVLLVGDARDWSSKECWVSLWGLKRPFAAYTLRNTARELAPAPHPTSQQLQSSWAHPRVGLSGRKSKKVFWAFLLKPHLGVDEVTEPPKEQGEARAGQEYEQELKGGAQDAPGKG